MSDLKKNHTHNLARDKFLGLSLESTRKSYYPQLKQQLEAAKENERHLQLLIDSLPARISYVDEEKCFVFANRGCQEALGLNRDQIVGKHVQNVLGYDNYTIVKHHIQKALEGITVHCETSFTSLNGEIQWLEITYVPDVNLQGEVKGFYDLTLDLTAKKEAEIETAKLEAKLLQAQKFEAIGTLAGGLAHDFNNLLMAIQGRTSLMAVDMGPDHVHGEHIRSIEEYIRSATNLTKQLLGFARGGKYEVSPVDVNDLVESSATLFGRTRKEIRIHTTMNQQPLVVEVDKGQIEQVLLNIFVNAWQAMPDGGELYLQAEQAVLGEAYCLPHGTTPGHYAKISITDTGIGMSGPTLLRIFDPFFTTKDKSRGTGLGLASAYGIIKNHGGMITVYSELGHGTTFNIYLPATEKGLAPIARGKTPLIRGTETILLIDDEQMIISVGRAMLQRLGYRVLVAKGGQAGIEMVSTMGSDIDLVILDLIMPGIDGGRTFDRIRDLQPDLPVILSSGYAVNGKASEILNRGCNGFIQKPFTLSEISTKIGSVLAKAT